MRGHNEGRRKEGGQEHKCLLLVSCSVTLWARQISLWAGVEKIARVGSDAVMFAPSDWFWISLSIFWIFLLEAEFSLRYSVSQC